ncbi:unnamed protein product [Brassica oleracea var. botrytis]|uniref:(rape) hypothetical protein n=1 Tax=Brassica napus TaxID=3708 RepID=A0A816KFX6_BRANA|nr:unnamed protein product [Brassica napus]
MLYVRQIEIYELFRNGKDFYVCSYMSIMKYIFCQ